MGTRIEDPKPGDYLPAIYAGVDYTGKEVGGNLVIGRSGTYRFSNGNSQQRWTVKCLGCDETRDAHAQHVVRGKRGCVTCASQALEGTSSPHWKGGKHVPGYFMAQFRVKGRLQRSRELEWALTVEDLDALWVEQEGRCAYTGWELTFGKQGKYGREQTASLDRIDSAKGYVPDNVQFVHKDINRMKWDHSEEWFLELCRTVVQHRKALADE